MASTAAPLTAPLLAPPRAPVPLQLQYRLGAVAERVPTAAGVGAQVAAAPLAFVVSARANERMAPVPPQLSTQSAARLRRGVALQARRGQPAASRLRLPSPAEQADKQIAARWRRVLEGGADTVRWVAQPPLPAGLRLDPRSGALRGTPAAPQALAAYVVVASEVLPRGRLSALAKGKVWLRVRPSGAGAGVSMGVAVAAVGSSNATEPGSLGAVPGAALHSALTACSGSRSGGGGAGGGGGGAAAAGADMGVVTRAGTEPGSAVCCLVALIAGSGHGNNGTSAAGSGCGAAAVAAAAARARARARVALQRARAGARRAATRSAAVARLHGARERAAHRRAEANAMASATAEARAELAAAARVAAAKVARASQHRVQQLQLLLQQGEAGGGAAKVAQELQWGAKAMARRTQREGEAAAALGQRQTDMSTQLRRAKAAAAAARKRESEAVAAEAMARVRRAAADARAGRLARTATGSRHVVRVWCDFVTDGGGYTYYEMHGGARSNRCAECTRSGSDGVGPDESVSEGADAGAGAGMGAGAGADSCTSVGLAMVVPRTRAHFSALLSRYGRAYFKIVPGIYGLVAANFSGHAMNSGVAAVAGTWRAIDGGSWWLRDTPYAQPSGNYQPGCWLGMLWDEGGGAGDVDDWGAMLAQSALHLRFDDRQCSYSAANYICSTNDKDPAMPLPFTPPRAESALARQGRMPRPAVPGKYVIEYRLPSPRDAETASCNPGALVAQRIAAAPLDQVEMPPLADYPSITA
eukprot:g3066.t1